MPRTPSGKAMTHSPSSSRSTQFFRVPTTDPVRTMAIVQPGHRRQPVLAHAADDPRRLGLEDHRRPDHRRVDGDLSGVVRDQQHATLRQPVDAVGLDAEPVAIQERGPEIGALRGGGVEAEGVVAVGVQMRGDAAEALVDLLLQRAERLADGGRRAPVESGGGREQALSGGHWRRCPRARTWAGTRWRRRSDGHRACTGT